MNKLIVMPWIDLLPNVASTSFQARRNLISDMMLEAAELTRKADSLRSRAYLKACFMESDAKSTWGMETIEQAKRGTA